MNINRVTLEGVNRPFQINMAALMHVAKHTGKTLLEILTLHTPDEEEQFLLFYAGLKFGAEASGERFDLTYSALVEKFMYDENESAFDAMQSYMETGFKEVIEILKEKAKKKAARTGTQIELGESIPE